MRTLLLTTAVVLLSGMAQAQVSCYTYGNVTTCNGLAVQPNNTAPMIYGSPPRHSFLDGMATGAGILESQARTELLRRQAEQLPAAPPPCYPLQRWLGICR